MPVDQKFKVKPKPKGLGKKEVPAAGGKVHPFAGKWSDSLAFRLYDLLKAGMSPTTAAGVMGVRGETVLAWLDKVPLAQAAKRCADAVREMEQETFQEYVYKQLPPDLIPAWKEIEAAGETDDPVGRIEAALKDKGKRGRQYLFMHALVHSNFNVSEASRKTNVARKTFELWCKSDDGFAAIIDQMHHSKKDLAEGMLIKLVGEGDTSAVLFANRTLNKDRGYGDSKTITVDQSVTHRHMIDIDELDLSLEVRKAILDAVRRSKAPLPPSHDAATPVLPRVRAPIDVFDAAAEDGDRTLTERTHE